MKILKGKETAKFITDKVYAKKQEHKFYAELTVGRVYSISAGGEIDFGGSEYKKAEYKPLKPEKKSEEDEYGWWNLKKGIYLFKFNELLKLAEKQKALIQPNRRFIEAGGFHPLFITEESGEISVAVNVPSGIKVKENARTSEVRIWEG